jgi:serine/threonine protein kinase/tetratricopeptide (TPR) repeat protein
MAPSKGLFKGTARFEVRRSLGAGGMGEVYEAFDRESQEIVALKTLLRAGAGDIYRFKNEFRSLADAAHPNLVSLYELVGEGDDWFFTMELIDGLDFLAYVRGESRPSAWDARWGPIPASSERTLAQSADTDPDPHSCPPTLTALPTPRPDATGAPDPASDDGKERVDGPISVFLDRLRWALKQLVEGVAALHAMGKLHRDLKPSNVMVNRAGRVIILDFGLITELATGGLDETLGLVGTPVYMSPEQAMGLPVTTASDWYSVGVILYEALAGRPPFTGSHMSVLSRKRSWDPPLVSSVVSDVPDSLDQLCRDLLARDPALRPSGGEILCRLGYADAVPTRVRTVRTAPLVGRAPQLAALERALHDCQSGQSVAVCIHGVSGIGKTALLRHFLSGLREQSGVVVLSGRCYERESVPYKALDGIIDHLTSYLLALPPGRAEALMPRNVLILSRLFPVLLRVPAVVDAPHHETAPLDPLVVRRRAFSALAEILGRMAERQTVVLHIDDLQWADADSVAFLRDLVAGSHAPALLLLASFRSEEIASKPFLQALLTGAGSREGRVLALEALNDDETRALATALLPQDAAVGPLPGVMFPEAGGSPFLVEQLVRYALAAERQAELGISLGQMLDARFRLLDPAARPLLETLAVAARPLDSRVAFEAAGVTSNERALVGALRHAQLLRSSGAMDRIEVYHDRIRETLTGLLPPEAQRAIHRRLAETLERCHVDDPEAILEHYLGAGEGERAALHARVAAERASAALAFDRAASLYRRALELSRAQGASLAGLRTKLAHALANAGRNPEAGRVFLEVASGAQGAAALDLRRQAAEQFLISGHVHEGLKVMRSGLSAVGLGLARTPRRALLWTVLRRLYLRMRGLRHVERAEVDVPEAELLRLDACWAVSVGLALVDVIRAAEFQTRHLLLALRTGEPYRLARALAVEAGFAATEGLSGIARSHRLSRAACDLAQRVGIPHAIGLAAVTQGIAAFCFGRWKESVEFCERAEQTLLDQCTGVTWELTSAQSFLLGSLMFRGEVLEVSRRLPALLVSARERGNLYASTELRTRSNFVWLASDDPDRALTEVTEAMREWTTDGFYRQHYNSLLARTQIALYVGDAEGARRLVESEWPVLARSLLLRVQILRLEAIHLRGRCALSAAASGASGRFTLETVLALAHGIEKEAVGWASPWAWLLRAGVAHLRGDEAASASLLDRAATGFDSADMALYAAVARRRLGESLGGSQGGRLIAESDAWLHGQGIRRPDWIARTLAPGFEDGRTHVP